jgi:hypothetical protein
VAPSSATTTAPGTQRGTPPASDFEDASLASDCSAAAAGVGVSVAVGAAADDAEDDAEAPAVGVGVAARRLVAAAVVDALADAFVVPDGGAVPATAAPFPGLAALVGLGCATGFELALGVGAAWTTGAATPGWRLPEAPCHAHATEPFLGISSPSTPDWEYTHLPDVPLDHHRPQYWFPRRPHGAPAGLPLTWHTEPSGLRFTVTPTLAKTFAALVAEVVASHDDWVPPPAPSL